jgi:nucleolar MIF4G domain-containing protein 1
MIETLTDLKNNKIKKGSHSQGSEIVERMKKFLSGLSKTRHGVLFDKVTKLFTNLLRL